LECECSSLIEIQGFGGYLHYSSTLNNMMKNVENGFFEIFSESNFEIIFQCKRCKQIWKLGKPDFPVQGYFLRSSSI